MGLYGEGRHRTTKEVSGCFWLFRLSDLSDSAVLVETVQWCRSCCPGVHFLKSCLHENYVKYSYISMVFRLHHVFYITFFCGVAMFRTISPSLHQAIRFGLPVNPIDPCPWIEFHLHRKETEETNAFIVFGWSRTEHRNVFYISMSTGSDWRCLTSFFIIFGPSWS